MVKEDQPINYVWWPSRPMKRVETSYLKDLECGDCKSKELVRFLDPEIPIGERGAFCMDCTTNGKYPREKREIAKREIYVPGLPEEFKKANFENLDEKPKVFIDQAKSYAKNPTGFFLIGGNPGVGKTHTVAAIMNQVAKHKYIRYIQAMELYQKWYANSSSYLGLLETMQDVFLLTIDDFGHKMASDPYMEFLHMLFSSRKSNNRPTIILTNHNQEEFMDNVKTAIFSRVTCGITHRLEGRDRRQVRF